MKKTLQNRHLLILKNSGQAVVESILLMSILLGVLSLVIKGFKDKKIIQELIATPWNQIDQVVRAGYIDINKEPIHPNSIDRHTSLDPQ